MNLVLTVLQITAPVFLLGAVGVGWVRALGWEFPLEFVTRLCMTIAVPCLIFTALMNAEIAPGALAALAGATLLTYLAVGAAFFVLTSVLALDRRTYLAPLTFGNTGNIGMPLALFAFGEVGLGYAVLVFAVMALITFTIGIWVVAGAGAWGRVLREPMVAASALGTLFLWQGWRTPDWLTDALTLAGQMAIPLMLITLGVAVSRLRPGRLGTAIVLSVLKAAVSGAIGVGAGWLLGLDPLANAVLILQVLTPVAVTSFLLAEKYGADSEAVAGLVVASTCGALVILPVALGLLLPGLALAKP